MRAQQVVGGIVSILLALNGRWMRGIKKSLVGCQRFLGILGSLRQKKTSAVAEVESETCELMSGCKEIINQSGAYSSNNTVELNNKISCHICGAC